MTQPLNRLKDEKSPYLRQHAENPVDWYPFGEAAFEKARKEDKPVFLSIGYATCHWCHVMAHESFEDPEVASLMNDVFVSVKVDREERPDIDHVYMTVCQMMTGGGGWPLNVLLTPDKEPFFAATYIPKNARFGKKGMIELVPEIDTVWRNEKKRVAQSAKQITEALATAANPAAGNTPGAEVIAHAFKQLRANFDLENGGFGHGMKFPTPHQIRFLLRYYRQHNDESALDMAERTLVAMRRGGIYDHIGFGFHRYATDPQWRVPHFEKMLYDQAQLMIAYADAFAVTGAPVYRETIEEVATYVTRDMTSPEGGFYSAEDADSEGVEGKYYQWEADELERLLTPDAFSLFAARFALTEEKNPFVKADAPDPDRQLSTVITRLYESRKERVPPLKDDKILTDWNGLMIAAFAIAGRTLGREDYVATARKAAAFVDRRLVDDAGLLIHRYRDGEAALPSHLDDYAFYLLGLIELYRATFDVVYLRRSREVADVMLERFSDPDGGALFFSAPTTTEALPVRLKTLYDGAIPSGNSVAFGALLSLSRFTGVTDYERAAAEIATGFGPETGASGVGYTAFLSALFLAHGENGEVVIVGEPNDNITRTFIDHATRGAPDAALVLKTTANAAALARVAPFTEAYQKVDDKPAAYVCKNQSCAAPTTDPTEIGAALGTVGAAPGPT